MKFRRSIEVIGILIDLSNWAFEIADFVGF
jgi:hypothetical protein